MAGEQDTSTRIARAADALTPGRWSNLSSHRLVHVAVALKQTAQRRVAAQVRHDPHLDLAVVRSDEGVRRQGRPEPRANVQLIQHRVKGTATDAAHDATGFGWNVLQIGVAAAEATRARAALVERRVDDVRATGGIPHSVVTQRRSVRRQNLGELAMCGNEAG